MVHKITILPGDGVGKEVIRETVLLLRHLSSVFETAFEFEEGLIGGAAIDATGDPLPEETLRLAKESDAVLMGAVGGPKWEELDYKKRPEQGLLALRGGLNAFANLRPARVFSPLIKASTLKEEVVKGVDILVVRELIGGIYFGTPKGYESLGEGQERGYNTMAYSTPEIERIAHLAFPIARRRNKKVTSVDKANVLESSDLWRRVVTRVGEEYSDVTLSHMYVDNCAMQLIRNPGQFDVILTTNLFGDILSDEAAMLTGSIGMLPSACIGGKVGLYEPVHGSAPDIAGQDKANPIASFLTAAMMLKYSFEMDEAASLVEGTVEKVLENGYRTQDIWEEGMTLVGTRQMGELIRKECTS